MSLCWRGPQSTRPPNCKRSVQLRPKRYLPVLIAKGKWVSAWAMRLQRNSRPVISPTTILCRKMFDIISKK